MSFNPTSPDFDPTRAAYTSVPFIPSSSDPVKLGSSSCSSSSAPAEKKTVRARCGDFANFIGAKLQAAASKVANAFKAVFSACVNFPVKCYKSTVSVCTSAYNRVKLACCNLFKSNVSTNDSTNVSASSSSSSSACSSSSV